MATSASSKLDTTRQERELKYKEILLHNGITEPVSEILVNDPGLRDGMLSEIVYVTVKFSNKDLPQLNLFVKQETRVPSQNEMISDLKAFEKEAAFFMEYVPAATKLCKGRGQEELMDIYPKCYYADEKLTIQENLVLNKGFSLNEREQGLEEAKISLLTLAKHHAISYAMIKECGGGNGFLEKFPIFGFESNLQPILKTMFGPMTVNGFKNNMKMLETYNVEGREIALERLKSLEKKGFYEDSIKPLEYSSDDLLVLAHGDYWNNNMMFLKDKETGNVLQHKAIDFQIVSYNSAGLDVGVFIFVSLKPEVRRVYLNDLLNYYLDNFKQIVKDLGHSVEITFEQFYLEFRKKFKFGFWFGFCVTIGPGMDFMKDINISELDDFAEFHVLADKVIQKWIDENPDKGEDAAKVVVSFVNEYYNLAIE